MKAALNAASHALFALVLLALGLQAAAAAPETVPETATEFGQRMAATIAGHPEVVGARRTLDAAQLGIDAARSGYYPRVSVGSELGRDNTVNATGTGTDAVSRRAVDVTLRQNVYTGGRLTAQIGIAQTEQSQLQNALRQAHQRVALEALTAHLQVSRAASLLALAGASEHATQGLLDLETRRVELGGGTRSDSDFARTRLALARERTRQYEIQLEEAGSAYRQVFQEPPQIEAMADLTLLPQRLPADLQTAIDMALASHPDLRAAELVRERATGNLALERAQRLPSVELVATRVIDNAPEAQASGRTNSSIGFKLNYSLYSGGESKARIGAAAAQMEAQAEALITARRLVEANVRIYHRRMTGAVERTALLQSAADDAYNVFVNRKRLREFGRETAVAVLDAQLEYNNVLISLVNATFDSRLNAIRLANALGILADDGGVAAWFSEFVDRERPLDLLRKRIDEAGRIDTAYRPGGKPTAPATAAVQAPAPATAAGQAPAPATAAGQAPAPAAAAASAPMPTPSAALPNASSARLAKERDGERDGSPPRRPASPPKEVTEPPGLEAAATPVAPPAAIASVLHVMPALPAATVVSVAPVLSSTSFVSLAVATPAVERPAIEERPAVVAKVIPEVIPKVAPTARPRASPPAPALASAALAKPRALPWRVALASPPALEKSPVAKPALSKAAVVRTASVRARHRHRLHRHAPPRPVAMASTTAAKSAPAPHMVAAPSPAATASPAPSAAPSTSTVSVISALNPFGIPPRYQQQGVVSVGLVADLVAARSRSRVLEARAHESPQ